MGEEGHMQRDGAPSSVAGRVFENHTLVSAILQQLEDEDITPVLGLSRTTLRTGWVILGKRRAFKLQWAQRTLPLSPARAAQLAAVRILTTDDSIQVHPERFLPRLFSLPDLHALCSKCPNLREVHCKQVDKDHINFGERELVQLDVSAWQINISDKTIRVNDHISLGPNKIIPSPYFDQTGVIESHWEGYTVERHISLDCETAIVQHNRVVGSQSWARNFALKPGVRTMIFDLDSESADINAGTTKAVTEALDARREAGSPIEEIVVCGPIDNPGHVVDILGVCADACRVLIVYNDRNAMLSMHGHAPPVGTLLRFSSQRVGNWVDTSEPHGRAVEVLDWSWFQLKGDFKLLGASVGAHLTRLDLRHNDDDSPDRNGIQISELYKFVEAVRQGMPNLNYLRFPINVSYDMFDPDTPYYNQALRKLVDPDGNKFDWPTMSIPNFSWPGPIKDIDVQLSVFGNGRYGVPARWDWMPYLEIATSVACLCADAGRMRVDQWTDNEQTDYHMPEQSGGMSDDEFLALMRWLLSLNEKQQAQMRRTDFRKFGLYPNRTEPFTWRSIEFDDQDNIIPLAHSITMKDIRALLKAVETSGTDSETAQGRQDALRDLARMRRLLDVTATTTLPLVDKASPSSEFSSV